ncbi:sensor histidine kinase [Streptomyces sp. NPDC051940]|uniref:sensor histidine kinase n=1 Tax=Streptomyces sp. NPDC051940 TaxID=3155675 RepID=UPI003414E1BB
MAVGLSGRELLGVPELSGGESRRSPAPRSRESVFVGVVTAVSLAAVPLAPDGRVPADAGAYLLAAVPSLALFARRRSPVAVLLLAVGCVFAYQLRGYPDGSPVVPVLIAVYTAVRLGHRRATAVVIGAGLVAGAVSLPFILGPSDELASALERRFLVVGWLVAGAVTAEMRRTYLAYVEQARRRVEEAERTREETARRRAGEERLRIARELHDSLTHSISVITLQAGVAVHLHRKRGEEVPAALLAIQEASADAARELRATLDVLREKEGSGLARLPALVDRARGAGVPAAVTVEGEPGPLPEAVDRAAYRIVQEALTNIARHAGPGAAATVLIRHAADALRIDVEDDGKASGEDEPGVGLTGMRERVTALGGELSTGPRPEGGFAVRAVLPLEQA